MLRLKISTQGDAKITILTQGDAKVTISTQRRKGAKKVAELILG